MRIKNLIYLKCKACHHDGVLQMVIRSVCTDIKSNQSKSRSIRYLTPITLYYFQFCESIVCEFVRNIHLINLPLYIFINLSRYMIGVEELFNKLYSILHILIQHFIHSYKYKASKQSGHAYSRSILSWCFTERFDR